MLNWRKPIILSLLAAFICIQTLPALAQQPAADNPLEFVPAEALFCIRINNFNDAMAQLDKYTEGLSPFGLGLMARLPLAQAANDPALKNIRLDDDLALFVGVCGTDRDIKENIFIGLLLPVTDYETFLREHPNASKPDDNGIARLGPAESEPKAIATKVGSYALFARREDYDKLVTARKALADDNTRTLADILDRGRARTARRAPIWAWANIQRIGEVFGPTLYEGLDKAKVQLEKMSAENKGMGAPANVMDMYVTFFKLFFQEVDSATWAITPSAEVLRLTTDLVPVEGGQLAKTLESSSAPRGPIALLPYLDDGAIMNIGMKNDKPLMKRFYDDMLSVFKSLTGDTIKPEDLDKFRKLTDESFDAFGDALVFSMASDPAAKPPFTMKYYAQIADPDAFKRILDEEIKLINAGIMNDVYKGMGLDMKFTAKRNAATYKGVSIDAVTLNIKGTGANAEMDKAIAAMYGEGLEYRWAIVDNLMVYAISGDVDKDIRALIDEVKGPKPQQLPKQMAEALAFLPRAQSAHAVGTVDLVKLIRMFMDMAAIRIHQDRAAIPQVDIVAESALAFAGRVRNGRITADCALPKKHLMEIKAAAEQMQRKAGQRAALVPAAPIGQTK
ncbi:MAG TPA: hypothetical protein P5279_01025 [Anaerohalosphaeraceae bacterium]|nr:hypothetical protein [Anaerohalosphaeraceae bacterium]HRT49048.1 hypothetical protein [Anaerohalosphaeraceae bacterium]HRT85699.1 hypothetical protein [Anaerohalosphaeraceae bacterium]